MKSNLLHLDSILECIDHVRKYIGNMTAEELRLNEAVRDAVIFRVALIGEAASHLSDDLKDKYSHIPWSDIVGMRNILIHDYEGIDDVRVWDVITEHLGPLKEAAENMIKELDQGT